MASEIRLAGGAGEYMDSATVVSWSVEAGAAIRAGDVVAVVETAKAATEIEAARDGVLLRIDAPVGTEVQVGSVMGLIGEAGETVDADPKPRSGPHSGEPTAAPGAPAQAPRLRMSPLARKLAAQAGLDPAEVTGTGPGGRIKARDIGRARAAQPRASASEAGTAAIRHRPSVSPPGRVPLVLVHGFGANGGGWSRLRACLGDRPSSTPELPGHGHARAEEASGLERWAASLLVQLEEAEIDECHLVGHSLGGAVAACLSENAAIRVRSLTLIAPAGLGPEIDGRFLDGFLAARSAESLAPWLERLVADRGALPSGFGEAILRERSRRAVLSAQAEIANRWFPDGTQVIRIGEILDRLRIPVTVIWGRDDRIIPASQAADLPGHVALHRLSGTGHMPQIEAPDLVARLVVQTARSAGGEGRS